MDDITYRWYTGISSIGIIDGMFHIQQWFDDSLLWNPPDYILFRLMDPYGEPVMFSYAPQWLAYVPIFIVDSYGNIIDMSVDEEGFLRKPEGYSISYHEYIYEVNMERLSEYRLVAEYLKGNHIEFSWRSEIFTIPALKGN